MPNRTTSVAAQAVRALCPTATPRIDRTKEHLLLDIIAIAILAVIAGADGWEAIELFVKSQLDALTLAWVGRETDPRATTDKKLTK